MRRSVIAVLAVLFLSLVSVYADSRPRISPPPLRAEAMTMRPSPRHVWVPGHWKWAGVNYLWVEGRWIKGKPGTAWIPGHWTQRGTYWVWTPGRWEKIKPTGPPAANKK